MNPDYLRGTISGVKYFHSFTDLLQIFFSTFKKKTFFLRSNTEIVAKIVKYRVLKYFLLFYTAFI